MKKLTVLLTTLALAGILANAADDDKNTRAPRRNQNQERGAAGDLDRHIQTVNRLDKNQSALTAGMAAVSRHPHANDSYVRCRDGRSRRCRDSIVSGRSRAPLRRAAKAAGMTVRIDVSPEHRRIVLDLLAEYLPQGSEV